MTFKNLKKHKEEDKNNYSAINDTTETASIAEDKSSLSTTSFYTVNG